MSECIVDNVKAVLFDHDDTLVGTISAKWEQHKHVARTFYGKELTDDELAEHWGKPLSELLSLLYETKDAQQAMTHVLATHEAFPKELFEATIPTLRRIKALGILVGIITATSRFSFEHDISTHDVPRDLLDYTQTADDTPYHKPDPRVFEPVLAWLTERGGKAKRSCLHWGWIARYASRHRRRLCFSWC